MRVAEGGNDGGSIGPGIEHQPKRSLAVDIHRRPDATDTVAQGGRDVTWLRRRNDDFLRSARRANGRVVETDVPSAVANARRQRGNQRAQTDAQPYLPRYRLPTAKPVCRSMFASVA